MKDETCGNEMTEFCGPRAKLYSYLVEKCIANVFEDMRKFNRDKKRKPTLDEFLEIANPGAEKKAKGISKTNIKKDLTFEDYKNCVLNKARKDVNNMRVIRSIEHTLYSQEISKLALDWKDDKRIILSDGISTRAIGHYLGDKEITKPKRTSEEEDEEELARMLELGNTGVQPDEPTEELKELIANIEID